MAFSFDATDYLTITDHADLTIPVGDWTFCGSFKVPASVSGGSNFPRMYQHGTATSSTPRIIIFYVESAAGYANDNHFCALVDDGSTSIGVVTVDGKNLTDLIGKWVHWCVTYDYSAKTMYVRILDRDNHVYYSKSGSAGSYLGAINPAVDATIAQGPGALNKFVGDMGEVAFIPGIFFDANTWHGYVHGGRPYRYPSNSWQVPMIGNRTTEIIGRGAYNLTMSASGAGVTEAPDSPQASSMFPPHFYNSSDAEEVESAPTTYRPLIISNGKIRQMRNGETLDATIISASEVVVGSFAVPAPTAAYQVLQATGANSASWTTDIQGLNSLSLYDNKKTYFGTSQDASIYYDGTDLVINPKEVGSGVLSVLGVIDIPTVITTPNYKLGEAYAGRFGFIGNRADGQGAIFDFYPTDPASGIDGSDYNYFYMWSHFSGANSQAMRYGYQPIGTDRYVFESYKTGTGSYLPIWFGANGTDYQFILNTDGSVWIPSDNQKLKFGAGSDASIYYDGTNMKINPKEVGTGILDVLGTLQTDGYNSADGTAGATADVAVAKVGGGTRTLSFKNGLYTGYTDS